MTITPTTDRRRFASVRWPTIVVVAALLLAACGTSDGGSNAQAPTGGDDQGQTGSGEPVYGGVLRVAHTSVPTSLDPHLATSGFDHYVLYPLYDRLVHFKPETLEATPGLAREWSYPDPQTFVLELQEGVEFHDGTPFNAEAVKINLERVMNHPDSAATADVTTIDSVEVVDDLTVQVNLNRPDTALPLILSDKAGMMVSPTAIEEYGDDLGNNPVGTGPFSFVSYVPGESLVLERFDGYWQEGLPYLDGMEFQIYTDSRTAVNALVSGQQDFATSIDAPDFDRVEQANGVELVVSQTLAFNRCTMRFDLEPFNSLEVRQAMNYGIDRDALNQVINRGLGEPAHAPLPTTHWAYPTDVVPVYEYDPERARELLADAGYPDGITIDTVVVTSERDRSMVEAMQSQLGAAGITLDVTVLDFAEASPAFRERDEFDMFCVGWSGRPDPYQTYAALYSSQSSYVNPYDEPEGLQEALDATVAVEDQEARAEAFAELSQLVIVDNALDLHVAMRPGVQAHADRVKGYVPNLYGKPIMNEVWLAE